MNHLPTLVSLLGLSELNALVDSDAGFEKRDEIKKFIADCLCQHTTEHWLKILDAADIWCAEVLDWPTLLASEAMQQLQMVQKLTGCNGDELLTTRCPVRLDRSLLTSNRLAPNVGEHTAAIQQEFGL